jgi:lipid-binding SYLF domain-containing protein
MSPYALLAIGKELDMRRIAWAWLLVFGSGLWAGGCATAPRTAEGRATLDDEAAAAVSRTKERDPGLDRFFREAAAYAVFPSVGKGAVGVGGAYGRGELYEGGRMAGYCTLSQATIGLALGGQAYTEIIFLETPDALARFKTGNFAFAAQASAVALKSGASADAKYEGGVLVFTMAQGGLMFEASIGGQKFQYEEKR